MAVISVTFILQHFEWLKTGLSIYDYDESASAESIKWLYDC